MKNKQYDRSSFFKDTFCVFKEVSLEEIKGKIPNYKSKSGSSYYFTEIGIYRLSNHWGRVANCRWRLEIKEPSGFSREKAGFAFWNDFYPNTTTDNLYFITVDYEKKQVQFEYKDSSVYDNKTILRTAEQTTKIVKQIRKLLTTDIWAKHFETEDISLLQKKIIEELINTNKPLYQIKRALL